MSVIKKDKEKVLELIKMLLSQVKVEHPRLKQVIKRELGNYIKEGDQKEVDKEVIRRLRIQNNKLVQQLVLMKDQLKQTKVNRNQLISLMSDLRKLNKSIADALGSCHSCWGNDNACQVCSGNGGPGWRNINRRLFNIYVLPALEKVYGLNK